MKENNTSSVFFCKIFNGSAILFLLLFSLVATSTPIITNVNPTKVTVGTTVTITGSGFTNDSGTVVSSIGGSSSGSSTYTVTSKSATQIVLVINGTVNGAVTVTVSGVSVTSSQLIQYIEPVVKNNSSNVKVDRIYTDYNGFWSSAAASSVAANQPNTRHNLLAFQYNGTVYSTGVDDSKLTTNGVTFNSQYYRAFSTQGVSGKTHSSLLLAMADLIDGTAQSAAADPNSTEIQGLTCYDVLVDGTNGLDLGTGVTNFNTQSAISFDSSNVQAGTGDVFFTDNIPDVLLTQIADPSGTDIYHFADENGNIIGHPVRITMASFSAIGRYRMDLFKFPNNADLGTATPDGVSSISAGTRDIRMIGLRFSDFGIDASNFSSVKSFDMVAGGGADIAFIAYNTASFDIKAPVIVSAPNSVNICSLPYNNSVTFSVAASTSGTGTTPIYYQWKKNNYDIPGATSNTYTIPGPIQTSDFATYKVEIYNDYGAIVASSAILKPGGTPAVWNGTSWDHVPTSTSSLIFTADYDSSVHLTGTEIQGCDCTVNNGVNVVIDSGDTMILQNSLKVTPAASGLPAGNFTIRNTGSLVQINESVTNVGNITYKRNVQNLHAYDYVYWSSPVENFNLTNLSSYPTLMYQWNPNVVNSNGTYGNWISASGIMSAAKGYISRVSNANNFTVNFDGVPHNGAYDVTISGVTNSNSNINNWNLLGNPYPSPIDAKAFLEANKNIEGTVRLWTHGSPINSSNSNPFYQDFAYNYSSGDYLLFNGTASIPAGFDGYIASGQGFFVQGLSNSGTVMFRNLFRYKSGKTAYDNSQFYRSAQQENVEKSVVWLSLIDETNSTDATTAIGYLEGATLSKDRLFDTLLTEPGDLSIYSFENTSTPLIIQGRPAPFNNTDEVPLGVTTPSNGIYKIAINNAVGVFEEAQDVFLEDKTINVIHNLKNSPYSFSSSEGVFNDRFVLRYTDNSTLSNEITESNLNTFTFIKNNSIEVKSNQNIKNIVVFDLTGKQITQFRVENTSKEFKGDFQYAQGIYLVQIQLENSNTITKKVVK